MPLVVPGINNTSGTEAQNWLTKLAGKTLGDSHSETAFAKGDLPKNSRVVEEGGMKTMDHDPSRLNIHVNKDGTVNNVTHG